MGVRNSMLLKIIVISIIFNLIYCTDCSRKDTYSDEEKVKRMSIISNGQIKMAYLAILGSKKINGVAFLHTEILKHQIFNALVLTQAKSY